ncbi:MAG: adenylate/guanylate cyclase domain-containing protein [Chthoniobacterales bacterium]
MQEQRIEAREKTDLVLEIAHLLFIDVVGYSKLLVNEQIELMQQLNRVVRSTDCFREAEASGKLMRLPTGDGMVLLFFHSPEQPAKCALQISEALRDEVQIQLRMGIHSGPVNQVIDVNDQINMAGAGINIGQRVMDCGDAGHILLSKHIAEDLAQYRNWQPYLDDLGECEVKHGVRLHLVNLHKGDLGNAAIPEKLRRSKRWKNPASAPVGPVGAPRWPKTLIAIALLFSGIALVFSLWISFQGSLSLPSEPTPSSIPEKSIAVLPFENRSEEKANGYFTDGIQDEILTRLAKIGTLKVISRTSTEHYKSTPENLPRVARELGVAHILEGSVQKSGDAVRVNVQLIRAATDAHIWAESYDRQLNDIFRVESDIATAIAEQLRAQLTGHEKELVAAKPTDNPLAYDAYLRGLAYTSKAATSPASTIGAQKYLREAVRLDPRFAGAWALLSYVDALSLYTFNFQSTSDLIDETRHAAETALALQPDLGEALLANGYYYFACLKDYDNATRFFEKAKRVSPNNSRVPEALAYVTRRQSRWEQSNLYFNEAQRLDPRNASLLTQQALSFIHLRRFEDAVRKLDQVLDITPDDVDIVALKGAIAQAKGDLARAASLLAPLDPTADHSGALETKAYQAILERRPAPMIARLKEVLAKPDPALGYINGELRFWLGWMQDVGGDHADARATWQEARDELHTFLDNQPHNLMLLGDLALTNLGLENRAEAMAAAKRAAVVISAQKDAVSGPIPIEIMARVTARTGDPDRSIAALQKLLSLPYDGALGLSVPLTPALLRLDPMFDSLRADERFKSLAFSDRAK